MPRRYEFTNSFSAGEVAPEFLLRKDLAPIKEALKTARNIRLLAGGGFVRRYGSIDIINMGSDAVIYTLGVGASSTLLVFREGIFIELNLDGTWIQQIDGAPWLDADLRSMVVAVGTDDVIIASNSFWPQRLKRVGGVWTRGNFGFLPGLNGSIRQPYWRFADQGVSILPSGYAGSVDVVASSPSFSPLYVGTRIRYIGVEIIVTAYTDATHITGTVSGGPLYNCYDVTVADASGFLVGQSVQGEDSNIEGFVVSSGGSTVQVQLTGGYSPFLTTEKLVGPTAVSAVSAVSVVGSPASSSEWDEQMISAVHGYPSTCNFHRNRLLFGDFPSAKAFGASAVGEINDFDVGTGLDSDAIVEQIGQDSALNIQHFGSQEQLIFLTEAGSYYVPEQVGAPLSPTNFDILRIGPEAAGPSPPVVVAEGLLFNESVSGRLMVVVPTGNVRHSWDISDVSELAFHLMGNPIKLAVLPAASESDRLVFQLRDDGVLAVMAYRRGQQYTAWGTWDTSGSYRSVTVANGVLYAIVLRNIGGVDTYQLEQFDPDTLGDGCVSSGGNISHFNGSTISVWVGGGAKIGDFPVAGGGIVGLPPEVTDYTCGFDFVSTAEIVPPVDPNTGLAVKGRITRAYLDVEDAVGVTINGYAPLGFDADLGVGGVQQPFTGQMSFWFLGHSRKPSAVISLTTGSPLKVSSITAEIVS